MPLNPSPLKQRLDFTAMAVLVLLCASWGFNQAVIKVTNAGISPGYQAALRSLIAGGLLVLWMGIRREPILNRDGTLWWGIAVGIIFSLEFMLIFWGLYYTTASRAVIFLYTMPFWVALGASFLIPGEKLRPSQIAGLLCAFGGILAAFGESFRGDTGSTLLGDCLTLGGALMWAALTLVIKTGPLARVSASKSLLYLLGISCPVLFVLSLALGEQGVTRLSPLIVACLAYQAIWVAAFTYLLYCWLIIKYPAARLTAFLFLTPLFGVLSGALFLNEPLTPMLIIALVLVAIGIYLVNRAPDYPQPSAALTKLTDLADEIAPD